MSLSPREVERIARLAELAVAPEELVPLSEQLDRIVGFVARLATEVDGSAERSPVGPGAAPLRDDVVVPPDPSLRPEALAPEFVDGFFVVPGPGAPESG